MENFIFVQWLISKVAFIALRNISDVLDIYQSKYVRPQNMQEFFLSEDKLTEFLHERLFATESDNWYSWDTQALLEA